MHQLRTEPAQPQPWERQPAETGRAFQAFAAYRDAGPQRSLARLAATLQRGTRQLAEWSRRWSWTDRAQAWDRHLDETKLDATEQERRDMVERHAMLAAAGLNKLVQRLHDEMKPSDLAQYARALESLVRVERLSRGLPTDHTEQVGLVEVDLLHIVHPDAAEGIAAARAIRHELLGTHQRPQAATRPR